MVKPKVSLDEIPVGRPRIQRTETPIPAEQPETIAAAVINEPTSSAPETQLDQPVPPVITVPKTDVPKAPQTKGPNERGGLRALKALRAQRGEYVLSVSLEEKLRDRLARASFESKVKQTSIVREALDEFLKKEGY
ncbi:hypothetical protein HW571_22875 [Agrobacterium genomosp. 3]|uniref:hypothetical protein n=1 Tax=Agrobacterium tomkonis TaxID=1183410 RepID=UPI001CD8C196|nr:hypothetical protein [Agrobacterium tomkonis]MCA1878833.1 hypothetical protein [Agrobacterium tumefaciens]MCA1894085.1 hypothetical protein [Agrobacterium tomkonis]